MADTCAFPLARIMGRSRRQGKGNLELCHWDGPSRQGHSRLGLQGADAVGSCIETEGGLESPPSVRVTIYPATTPVSNGPCQRCHASCWASRPQRCVTCLILRELWRRRGAQRLLGLSPSNWGPDSKRRPGWPIANNGFMRNRVTGDDIRCTKD